MKRLIAPKAKSAAVSRTMRANKSRDTSPEIILRKALSKAGVRGYRLNFKSVAGRPDICFAGKKIAIFVNGCFWHRCPRCKLPLPKTHISYWSRKFATNVARDIGNCKKLKKAGWHVYITWECQIKSNPERIASKVAEAVRTYDHTR